MRRLYDSRFGDGDVRDIGRYIRLGPLGQSFAAEDRVVLLIDEVDKADIEFPNDLLHELDRMRFTISETDEEVVARQRPVVIITSNNEKELPDAFLRRCVFHFIEFPDEALMQRIVRVHHPEIRSMKNLRKRPSTSELIDWIAALQAAGVDNVKLERSLPFLGALLKKEQDLASYADAMAGGRRWRS
jgi:MoxR-like ATPase